MADGRRTRWVAHDVYFLDEGLGQAMFDRFGACGIALWHGFIAACKKNHIEGETSFATDAEALSVFGLPGMPLVDLEGETFELDDWLKLLSDHKVIRRRARGRRVQVACTKWGRWQQAANRHRKAEQQAARRDEAAEQNRRSEGGNTGTVQAGNGHDAGPKQAQMTDTDTDTDSKDVGAPDGDAPNAGQLMAEHLEKFTTRPPAKVVSHTAREVKGLIDEGIGVDHIRAGLDALRTKSLHPSTLASLVNEEMNPATFRGKARPSEPPPRDADYLEGWSGKVVGQ